MTDIVCCLIKNPISTFRIEAKDIESEVNEYLSRAIDARSVDRLRAEHVKGIFMKFRKKSIEEKVGFIKIVFTYSVACTEFI